MFWNGTRWVPEEPPPRAGRAPTSRLTAWIATLVMALGLVAPAIPALVAAHSSSSIWVVELTATLAPQQLRYGQHFTVGYSTSARQPWALAQCYPNATTEYSGTHSDGTIWSEWYSVYPGGPSPQNFILGDSVSPLWTGGGADCTVTLAKLSGKYRGALGYSNVTVLATATFVVAP